MTRTAGVCAAIALGAALTGCGSSEEQGASTATTKTQESKTIELLKLNPDDGDTIQDPIVLVTGKVNEPGANVEVGDKELKADEDGTFRVRIRLEVGDNDIDILATKGGPYLPAQQTITLTRELSPAERKERAERRRAREEAKLAELRANAQQIDPGLLQKDPDRYYGETVVMTGEIFQIQEGGGNFLLMSTECDTEYDITLCDGPDVYVSYDFSTDKQEEDLVTVYGIVKGGKEYDTQIGGSNYVAHIKARIIE
jgi:hypothetical protein